MYLVIAVVVTLLSDWMQSTFLDEFLGSSLITLLVALLAINTTTIGLIASKLRDLSDKYGINVARTINSMKSSVIEQIVLLIIATSILLIKTSTTINSLWLYNEPVTTVILIMVFIWAVQVLYDTASGIFVILEKETGSE